MRPTTVLLAVLLAAAATWPPTVALAKEGADLDACKDACDDSDLDPPEKPSPATYDTTQATLEIAENVVDFIGEVAESVLPLKIAASLVKVGLGTIMGVKKTKEDGDAEAKAEWNEYKLAEDMAKTREYLVCKMESFATKIMYNTGQVMNSSMLNLFNSAIRGIQKAAAEGCPGMNCLHYQYLAPNERNAAAAADGARVDCASKQGSLPDPDCAAAKGKPWSNETVPLKCDSVDGVRRGVCGTDGYCYGVYDVRKAQNVLKGLLDKFVAKDAINNFENFDEWMDPGATVALAKGAMLKILLLQQRLMLDGASGTEGELTTFATAMAAKLQERIDFHLDHKRILEQIEKWSFPNVENPTPDSALVYPKRPAQGSVQWDSKAMLTDWPYCQIARSATFVNWRDQIAYILPKELAQIREKQQVRYTCAAEDTMAVEHVCQLPYNNDRCDKDYDCKDVNGGSRNGFLGCPSTIKWTVGGGDDYPKIMNAAFSECKYGWFMCGYWDSHYPGPFPDSCDDAWTRCNQGFYGLAKPLGGRDLSTYPDRSYYFKYSAKSFNDTSSCNFKTKVHDAIEAAVPLAIKKINETMSRLQTIANIFKEMGKLGLPEAAWGALARDYPLYACEAPKALTRPPTRCGGEACQKCDPKTKKCLTCPAGGYLRLGQCLRCPDEHAATCARGSGATIKCKPNFALQGRRCVFSMCPEPNCDWCPKNRFYACKRCASGYKLVGTRCVSTAPPTTRVCGAGRPNRIWPGKASKRLSAVKTYAACCAKCRANRACRRFHVGPKGCFLFTKPYDGRPRKLAGYKAGNVYAKAVGR